MGRFTNLLTAGAITRGVGLLLSVALMIGFYRYIDQAIGWQQLADVETLREHFRAYGIWAPLLYIALLAAAVVISQVPNVPLAIASGMLFGPLLGGIYSLIGGLIGAIIAFSIGRFLGRAVVKLLLGKTLLFCDRCTNSYIGRIILITRLLPIFSFDLISYGAGLTSISLRAFVVATAIGMTPMTFVLTTMGDVVNINAVVMGVLTLLVLLGLFLIPLLIRRYNWLDLRGRIRLE